MCWNITDSRLKDNRIFPLVAFCIVVIWCMRTVFLHIVQKYRCICTISLLYHEYEINISNIYIYMYIYTKPICCSVRQFRVMCLVPICPVTNRHEILWNCSPWDFIATLLTTVSRNVQLRQDKVGWSADKLTLCIHETLDLHYIP